MAKKISVNVKPAAKRAGIMRANQLGTKAGLAPGVAAKWWKADERDLQRIELSVLERICNVCGCGIPDILTLR